MPQQSKADIIRGLFTAYESRDRKAVEDLFTDDFRFTSPYDDAIDKATYFERCWSAFVTASGHIRENVVEKVFVEGDEAFVLYKCLTQEGREFRNTEFFRFAGDRIRQVDVYFGATYKDGTFVKQK
jgi:ketosteroid isomerase-like protein